MRTNENVKHWPLYSPLEERNFRMAVFRLIVENKLRTPNDYYRAAIILLHSKETARENYLLAGTLGEKLTSFGDKRGKDILAIAASKYAHIQNLPNDNWLVYDVKGKLMTHTEMMEIKN